MPRGYRDEDHDEDDTLGCDVGEVRAKHETLKALLVRLNGRDVWVPKSVIHEDSEVFDNKDHKEGILIVKKWFADKEGLT